MPDKFREAIDEQTNSYFKRELEELIAMVKDLAKSIIILNKKSLEGSTNIRQKEIDYIVRKLGELLNNLDILQKNIKAFTDKFEQDVLAEQDVPSDDDFPVINKCSSTFKP